MDEGILEVDEVAGDRVVELRGVGYLRGVGLITCEGAVIVQGDEGPVCGVAQVVDCHGVTVGHQEREEEEEEQQDVVGDGEEHSKNAAHVHGWDEGEKTSASGHEPCGVMNDQTRTLKTACWCAQFCMLRMSTCVASFMLLSTMVSPMLKVCLLCTHFYVAIYVAICFVNCCIRRYSIYILTKPLLGDSLSQVCPIHREQSLRTLRNAHSCREDILHDERQLFATYPKKLSQVSLIDRAPQLHFSTLEKTKIDHNPLVNTCTC